jgi:hypothetical protein
MDHTPWQLAVWAGFGRASTSWVAASRFALLACCPSGKVEDSWRCTACSLLAVLLPKEQRPELVAAPASGSGLHCVLKCLLNTKSGQTKGSLLHSTKGRRLKAVRQLVLQSNRSRGR